MEEKIKEYVKNGGRLFTIESIDTIRDGGTKIIKCTNSDTFYINKEKDEFHLQYPLDDDNKITDTLLKHYLLDRITVYVERLGSEYERNKNLLSELSNVL